MIKLNSMCVYCSSFQEVFYALILMTLKACFLPDNSTFWLAQCLRLYLCCIVFLVTVGITKIKKHDLKTTKTNLLQNLIQFLCSIIKSATNKKAKTTATRGPSTVS